jgi:S1-C subfamily serine protease
MDSARGNAAPAAVVESLRTALNDAKKRTTALEASVQRAQTSLSQQLAAGDSMRRQAHSELQRLQNELNRANSSSVSTAELDSLRKAVREAQDRASSIEGQLRAVKTVDFTTMWQANQGAVGLVVTFAGSGAWNGTGFVITKSGYLVTNRHVVQPEEHEKDSQGKDSLVIYQADSVFVVMADHRYMLRSAIVAVSPLTQPDLAIVRIANYSGPVIGKINWDASHVRPGEPGALIGFPAGASLALDQTQTVRTSFSAGSFSKVTPELIQFGGFTIEGSSGSPVFNANGEIVAVHAAGLRQGPGLAFGVPVKFVIPLLPPDAKAELGLP